MTNTLQFIAGCVVALLPFVQQQPVFRGRVDLVAVDVHVVDGSGRPVADLRAEDFTLKVDGKPRPIVAADYVSHGVTSTSVPGRPPSAPRGPLFSSNASPALGAPGRTLLLAVDESNIGAGNGHWAMTAAERFLDQMGPDDRVGLALIPYAHRNIDPTTDRAAVREALQQIVGHLHTVQPGSTHSLGLVEAFAFANDDKRTWNDVVRRECVDVFPTPSAEDIAQCTRMVETDARGTVSDARQRLIDSVRSFTALLTALADLPGPKTLVLISEELPVSIPSRPHGFRRRSQPDHGCGARVPGQCLRGPVAHPARRCRNPSSAADEHRGRRHPLGRPRERDQSHGWTRQMISGQPGRPSTGSRSRSPGTTCSGSVQSRPTATASRTRSLSRSGVRAFTCGPGRCLRSAT
jgi:VWFA-related protein